MHTLHAQCAMLHCLRRCLRVAMVPCSLITVTEAMRFNGPAPELINGRLAMVGLLAVAMQEAETGQTALHQVSLCSSTACLVLVRTSSVEEVG